MSRLAVYELLVELADGCLENLEAICRQLVAMHHQANTDVDEQWEVSGISVVWGGGS